MKSNIFRIFALEIIKYKDLKLSNKKLQERCWQDAQSVANEINEAIVYNDEEDKFYRESEYKKECEKVVLAYKDAYTEENWEKDKTNSHLFWYYPAKKE